MHRLHHHLSLILGRHIRAARYSVVHIIANEEEPLVRKHRTVYAPLLVSLGALLVQVLDTGLRVLPQRDWERRETALYRKLYDGVVRVQDHGVLVLPFLPGRTLAELLEDEGVVAPVRNRAVERAVVALRELHRQGITHGDAMAENVMVDLEAGAARWFDFETVHDPGRAMSWRRADDVRALIATTVLRVTSAEITEVINLILDTYADDDVTPFLVHSFSAHPQRARPFHLGQAPLSFDTYRTIARALATRTGA